MPSHIAENRHSFFPVKLSPLQLAIGAKVGKGVCAYITHQGAYQALRGARPGLGAFFAAAGTLGIGALLGFTAHELGDNEAVQGWVDKHIRSSK